MSRASLVSAVGNYPGHVRRAGCSTASWCLLGVGRDRLNTVTAALGWPSGITCSNLLPRNGLQWSQSTPRSTFPITKVYPPNCQCRPYAARQQSRFARMEYVPAILAGSLTSSNFRTFLRCHAGHAKTFLSYAHSCKNLIIGGASPLSARHFWSDGNIPNSRLRDWGLLSEAMAMPLVLG